MYISLKSYRLIEEYIYTLKTKHNEQLLKIESLSNIEQAKSNKKDSLWKKSSQKILNMKQGFTQLLTDKLARSTMIGDHNTTSGADTTSEENNIENLGNKSYFTRYITKHLMIVVVNVAAAL